MNKDIRLSIGYFRHPKTRKLHRTLGYPGVVSHLKLMTFCGEFKTDGVFRDMAPSEIEEAAEWEGVDGQLLSTLESLGLVERIVEPDAIFQLHNWLEHNEYAAHAKARSEKARKAAQAKHSQGKKKG